MADAPTLPPDKDSPHRKAIIEWDRLWKGQYQYDSDRHEASAAPGYTRSFSLLVAGLFERQTPSYEPDMTAPPLTPVELSELMHETVSRTAGYGLTLVRPVSDGTGWKASVLPPTMFHVRWVHRRPVAVTVWDHAADPRTDNDRVGLAFVEQWTPVEDGPGMVETRIFETVADPAGGGMRLALELDATNPPAALEDHPFFVSARNDPIRRDVYPYVWAWEDLGPVPLWYTNENVIRGLARLWDQEQDDAEMTRKRVAMPDDTMGRATVRADGSQEIIARPGFRKHDNILLLSSSMSAEHGPNGGVTPIEFGDDLIQRDRIERRENALLEAVGINPASIGRNVSGRSDSGVAKRADNQMTMNTITAPARRVEGLLTAVTRELARLNNMPSTEWSVSVHEGLKTDPDEAAATAVKLRDAEAASTKTRVQTAHPTWSVDEVDAEVLLIESSDPMAPLEF